MALFILEMSSGATVVSRSGTDHHVETERERASPPERRVVSHSHTFLLRHPICRPLPRTWKKNPTLLFKTSRKKKDNYSVCVCVWVILITVRCMGQGVCVCVCTLLAGAAVETDPAVWVEYSPRHSSEVIIHDMKTNMSEINPVVPLLSFFSLPFDTYCQEWFTARGRHFSFSQDSDPRKRSRLRKKKNKNKSVYNTFANMSALLQTGRWLDQGGKISGRIKDEDNW